MATLKLDDYLGMILPWDLSIEIDGVPYATRPPLIGDLAVLEAAEVAAKKARENPGQASGSTGILKVVRSMFVDPLVPLDGKPIEVMGIIITLIMEHWGSQQKKTMGMVEKTRSSAKQTVQPLGESSQP
jgi:hypothetical protein